MLKLLFCPYIKISQVLVNVQLTFSCPGFLTSKPTSQGPQCKMTLTSQSQSVGRVLLTRNRFVLELCSKSRSHLWIYRRFIGSYLGWIAVLIRCWIAAILVSWFFCCVFKYLTHIFSPCFRHLVIFITACLILCPTFLKLCAQSSFSFTCKVLFFYYPTFPLVACQSTCLLIACVHRSCKQSVDFCHTSVMEQVCHQHLQKVLHMGPYLL